MTQQQLADQVGIGRASVAEIETGKRFVRIGEACRIAEVLGASLVAMCGEEPLVLASEPVRVA